MALSHRFGQIQHRAKQYEDESSEEHELLRNLMRNSSLFNTPTFLVYSPRIEEDEEVEEEEEFVDPLWKVEFQNIMMKCKLKQTVSFNKVFDQNMKRNKVEVFDTDAVKLPAKPSYSTLVHNYESDSSDDNGSPSEHTVNDSQSVAKEIDYLKSENRKRPLNEQEKHCYVNNIDKKKEIYPFERLISSENTKAANVKISSGVTIDCMKNVENKKDDCTNVDSNQIRTVMKNIPRSFNSIPKQEFDSMISVGKTLSRDSNEDKERQSNKMKLVPNTVSTEIGSLLITDKIMKNDRTDPQVSTPCEKVQKHQKCHSKEKNGTILKQPLNQGKEVKSRKNVIKVIPAMSFPLDELLPKEPVKDTKEVKCSAIEEKQKPEHDIYFTQDTAVACMYEPETYQTNLPDFHFHGEVYTSPFSSDSNSNGMAESTREPSSENKNEQSMSLASDFGINQWMANTPSPFSTVSLENFSFIRDALLNGNIQLVEQLQNVISQQLKSQQSPHHANEERLKELGTFKKLNKQRGQDESTFGIYPDTSSSMENKFGDLQNMHDYCQGKLDTRTESSVSEKGDNLDKQSKELFELFVNQCSQLVKTDEDHKMLSSLVHLLKKESGAELGNFGFTPPATPRETYSEMNSSLLNAESKTNSEIFEGRTLLKGGVEPRRIPKTTIVKSGRGKPTDPRPISTILVPTVPKAIPLPRFVHDIWDESRIQRVLTLDWDSKRVHYLEESDAQVKADKRVIGPSESKHSANLIELQHPFSPTKTLNSYNPSKELQKILKVETKDVKPEVDELDREATTADVFLIDSKDRTPVKDEVNKPSTKENQHPTNVCVYGNVQRSGAQGFRSDLTNILMLAASEVDTNMEENSLTHSLTKLVNFEKEAKEKEPSLPCDTKQQLVSVNLNQNNETTVPCNLDIEPVYKSGSFLQTAFCEVKLPISMSELDSPDYPDSVNNTLFAIVDEGNENKALDLTVRQNKHFKKDDEKTETDEKKKHNLSPEIRYIPTVITCVDRQESSSTTSLGIPNSNNLVVLNDMTESSEMELKMPFKSSTSAKEVKPCVGIVKPMPHTSISRAADTKVNIIHNTASEIKRQKITPTQNVSHYVKEEFVNTVLVKPEKNSVKIKQECIKRTKTSPVKEKSQAKCEQEIIIDLTQDDSGNGNIIPKAKRTKLSPKQRSKHDLCDKVSHLTNTASKSADNVSNKTVLKSVNRFDKSDICETKSSSSVIANDRKRKVGGTSDSQQYSDLEEGQLISDSSSEADGNDRFNKKKADTMRKAALSRSRHYRDRKRHSSCSSVESVKQDDHYQTVRRKHRHASISSSTSRNGSRHSSPSRERSSERNSKEFRKDSRKRHHTVHDETHSSKQKKRNRLETETIKRRYSDENRMLLNKHDNKDDETKKVSNFNYYETILSPECASLSDETLSEEYRKLFGKSSEPLSTSETTKTKIFNNEKSEKKVDNKALLDDLAFLKQYKQKVEKKDTPGFVSENKKEKTLSKEQELEDRKFLLNCKKKIEEKAKKSVHERLGAYFSRKDDSGSTMCTQKRKY